MWEPGAASSSPLYRRPPTPPWPSCRRHAIVSRTIRPDLIRGGPNAGGNPEYRTLAGVGHEVEAAPAAGRYLWEGCMHRIARTVIIAAGLGLIAASSAWAQDAKPVHLRGTVEKVDGNVITAKSREGK